MTKLEQYVGELSPAQIAEGMNLARRNAQRLFRDAKELLERSRFPSAASLAILSIEESGKITILRTLAMVSDDNMRLRTWREYRSHRHKNTMWILPQLVADGARSLHELQRAADPMGHHTAILDNVKQLGFYTDCLGDAHWSDPVEVVDESLATALTKTAGLLAGDREISKEEIELWIEHMRPAYGKPLPEMKQALENWYKALRANGLTAETEASVAEFLYGKAKG